MHQKAVFSPVKLKTQSDQERAKNAPGLTNESRKRLLPGENEIPEGARVENEMRRSEEKFRSFVEQSHDGIIIIDEAGTVVEWNRSEAQITGITRDEALNRPLWEIQYRLALPEFRNPQFIEKAKQVMFSGMTEGAGLFRELEEEIERSDGSRRQLHSVLFCVQPTGQRLFGCITRDVTERKRAEQELQRLNQTLEAQVAERTALAEARSKQLQSLAVELIEAEEFERQRIAGILHEDLQQLLAAAKFTLQSKSRLDPDLKLVQRLLEDSIRKSRHLSHELSPAVLRHADLPGALEWLCRNMRERFKINVAFEAEESGQLESGPSKIFIFRAVQELLFNIVKHAGVKVGQVKLSGSDGELVITVSDSGKGFDTAGLDTYKSKAGLGLRSLRERAIHVGGSLTIESAPGHGSRFILRVPVEMRVAVDPYPSVKPPGEVVRESVGASENAAEPHIRLLFADDHKVMRQGLIRLVSGKPGLHVVGEAANGKEALEKARSLRPNVVVMDVSMPVMDGIESTRLIKAELPEVQVIGLSMHEDEQVSRNMREAGAEAFLSKASSSAELLKAIYEIVGMEEKEEKINKPIQLTLPWQ